MIMPKDGDPQMVFTGNYITQGKTFDLDVLFTVPVGSEGLRLSVAGAAPVPIDIAEPDRAKERIKK